MWDLLYTLRSRYIAVPLYFDDDDRGFDFGIWTTTYQKQPTFFFDTPSSGWGIGIWEPVQITDETVLTTEQTDKVKYSN